MQDLQNHAENFLREIKPLPESNPIIAAIAAYLDDKTTARVNQFEEFNLEFVEPINGNYNDYLIKLSTEIAAAIAPMVDEQAQDFAGWICHQVVAGRTYNKLWADYCEEKAIAPLVEAVEPDWKDAPEWAKFKTIDKNHEVTFWEKEPHADLNREFWMERSIDGKFQTRKYDDNWANSMQKRPA